MGFYRNRKKALLFKRDKYQSKPMRFPQPIPFLNKSEKIHKFFRFFFTFSLLVLFHGCATIPQPKHVDNICEIFREHPKWYESTHKSYKKWGTSIPILMAIMHQESRFVSDAKPPRTSCLWIFPGPRPSSAYGYSQASNETWRAYIKNTGNTGADRDDFSDAIDFVGWYCNQSHIRCKISKNDTYNLYLAYHDGHGGFNKKTFQRKAWLIQVARKVQSRASAFKSQLASCEREFRKKGCCFLWPF